jgi:hypothetical protein
MKKTTQEQATNQRRKRKEEQEQGKLSHRNDMQTNASVMHQRQRTIQSCQWIRKSFLASITIFVKCATVQESSSVAAHATLCFISSASGRQQPDFLQTTGAVPTVFQQESEVTLRKLERDVVQRRQREK